jgi:hypothetical protein
MHVLSFGEGRRSVVVFLFFCDVLVILSLTWRHRGRHGRRLVDWRFDCVVFVNVCCVVGIWSWDWFLA